MSFSTAIAKLKYWDNTDRPDIGQATQQLALSVEPSLIPPFATTAARDAAITSTVRANAPLAGEGLKAYIDNIGDGEWDGAAWAPLGSRVIATYAANPGQTVGAAANGGVTFVSGVQGAGGFTLTRKRNIEVAIRCVISGSSDAVGSQFRVFINEAAGEFIDHRDNLTGAGGAGAKWFRERSEPVVMNAGGHNLGCSVSLISGNGIFTILSLNVTVIDVGPAL